MARESNFQIGVEANCEEYCSVEAIDMSNISLSTPVRMAPKLIVYFQFLNIEIIP
jgi:hypothetical protein